MWAIIATWRMSYEGLLIASKLLSNGDFAGNAIETAIKEVEDFEYYKSVGYGGLPNEKMEVELDAAYMDGTNLDFGAVCALQDIKNPISVARSLSKYSVNNILVGNGAKEYAIENGFKKCNMLTKRAIIHYKNRLYDMNKELKAYSGHDTVGMVALDKNSNMVAATSTSGLFMKKRGRVGDSPFIGSGLYVDSKIGGATATGLGEDIMKGVISYEIVKLMKQGKSPQEACEIAVYDLEKQLLERRKKVSDISVVAINNKGEYGVATNIENFSFVISRDDIGTKVYRCKREGNKTKHILADKKWLDDYLEERMKPLEEKYDK